MASGLILDYLGSGVIADRPATLDLYDGALGLWWATDTETLSAWDGTAWEDIGGGGSGMTNPMTTAGDLIVGGVAGAPARLAVGSDGQILKVVSGAPAYVDPGAGDGDVVGPAASVDSRPALFDGTTGKLLKQAGKTYNESRVQSIIVACSDETTNLTTGTAKATFRMPYAFTLTGVRASLTTAQASGSIFTVDINENGSSILSTKLTIDNTEKTSTTAATPAVISDSALADDAEITIDIDQVGTAGAKGLKVALIGYPT